ncbi:MAG TPA: SLBB domain-containing protein [Verrucomicrobiota bacterium]|nr:hypothetical protein [Verrucomicrobiales bacterium]HRI14643.1 SLBB domain-containing protein [Verrucomicrobiota bacterium]
MSVFRLTLIRALGLRRKVPVPALAALAITLLAVVPGCASKPSPAPPTEADAAVYEGGKIQIGDQVKVLFPGAPNLNFVQAVRVDGMLDLGQSGDLKVEGKTADEVEAELLTIFSPELIVKEVTVSVESVGFPIFVSGMVRRPGKVMVNRSVTVLEAIMEAGGFDTTRANLSKVQVIRQENGVQRTFVIDVQTALAQAESKPFHLRPADIVFVPERFIYF